jgi:hypothetical protein
MKGFLGFVKTGHMVNNKLLRPCRHFIRFRLLDLPSETRKIMPQSSAEKTGPCLQENRRGHVNFSRHLKQIAVKTRVIESFFFWHGVAELSASTIKRPSPVSGRGPVL